MHPILPHQQHVFWLTTAGPRDLDAGRQGPPDVGVSELPSHRRSITWISLNHLDVLFPPLCGGFVNHTEATSEMPPDSGTQGRDPKLQPKALSSKGSGSSEASESGTSCGLRKRSFGTSVYWNPRNPVSPGVSPVLLFTWCFL